MYFQIDVNAIKINAIAELQSIHIHKHTHIINGRTKIILLIEANILPVSFLSWFNKMEK